MQSYLPDPADLYGLAGLAVTLTLCLVIGSLAPGARTPPEVRIAAGWGLMAIVLTVWGVASAASLQIPLGCLALLAVVAVLVPSWRRRIGSCPEVGRMAILTLPLWIVMAPSWPSQVDTWLNLLPNAAYLFDHDMLPRHDRPPAWSFLPVAPYNTQFVAYAASVVAGRLLPNGMALFNLALLAAAGLLLARVLAGSRAASPPWWAVACGLGLAIPLNPGFVPRTFMSSYGETPLAVCALFAVWLAADALRDMADRRTPDAATALALVLAALVNVKQSGIGLLTPIVATFLLLAVTHPAIGWRRGTVTVGAIVAPAIALWLLWRGYALTSFDAGELRPLPMSQWNVVLLPTILAAALKIIFQKATLYVCLAVVIAATVRTWQRAPRTAEATVLALITGSAILYNGFVLFTYVAHFPAPMAVNAHSYFRYSGHLSLLIMLGLAVALRPVAAPAVARWRTRIHLAAGAAITAAVLFPFAIAPLLRFDLQAPQPAMFALAPAIAAHLPPDARLAILIPGDPFDATGSFVRGTLLFLQPRRAQLELRTETHVDAATLEAVGRSGYDFALVTCVPPNLGNIPANVAALLHRSGDDWQVLETWQWPDNLSGQSFAGLLEYAPFCARRAPGS